MFVQNWRNQSLPIIRFVLRPHAVLVGVAGREILLLRNPLSPNPELGLSPK